MIKSLIEFLNYLGRKEAGQSCGVGGNLIQTAGSAGTGRKVTDRPKTAQPEFNYKPFHNLKYYRF